MGTRLAIVGYPTTDERTMPHPDGVNIGYSPFPCVDRQLDKLPESPNHTVHRALVVSCQSHSLMAATALPDLSDPS